MRIDIMVDLETLGTDPSSTIFQIAAAAFDITTGEIGGRFNKIADIGMNPSYDMTVEGKTLKWWLSDVEKADTFRNLINAGKGSTDDLIEDFRKWLQGMNAIGDVYLWGNGILFDNLFLKQAMGDDYPIFFRNDRDVRTIVDMAMQKTGLTYKQLIDMYYDKNLVAHDAEHDVYNQVQMVTACWEILTRGTMDIGTVPAPEHPDYIKFINGEK